MREHLPKLVIATLLVLIVVVPLLMRGGEESVAVSFDGPAEKLILYTPHNEQIRYEIAAGFNRYRAANGLSPVVFDWRTSGGTSDLRKQVLSQYEALVRDVSTAAEAQVAVDRGIGADVFFGGGEFEHNMLIGGIEVEKQKVAVVRPVALPPGLLEEAFPEPTIGGEKLYHPDLLWIGTTLSSFGIVYNRDLLTMRQLPEPLTWAVLADPRYFGDVALADPGHSGSIAVTYETIVKREGWTEGWALLRRTFGNARYFSSSASKVPVDVSTGEAAAGMCIDFYGRFQAGAIANADGSSRVGYADPIGMTATTADPISILRGAPHGALADEFVAWCLSVDAQRLWQYRAGVEGGPVRYELRRQPIRTDLFTDEHRAHFTDPEIDPFGQAVPMPPGIPSYYSFVAPIAHAIAIDSHDLLKAAWSAIIEAGPDHPQYGQMLALFDAMPEELVIPWPDEQIAANWHSILSDPTHARHAEVASTLAAFRATLRKRWTTKDDELADRLAWTAFFADNYRQIVRLASR